MSDPWWSAEHVKNVIDNLKLAKRDCRICCGRGLYYIPLSKTVSIRCPNCKKIDEAITQIQRMHAAISILGIIPQLHKEEQ